MMVALPTSIHVSKGWNDWFEINKDGYIGVDGVEYGPFWDLLSMINKFTTTVR